ncbi:hypothetical protein J6590_013231 [Homalodisca vitripennis]|nr:hypothetical protein J6590_013231 [Homalodisca vitripennis]
MADSPGVSEATTNGLSAMSLPGERAQQRRVYSGINDATLHYSPLALGTGSFLAC